MKRSKWLGGLASVVCTAVLAVSISIPAPVQAASNMVPDYEVKLLMQPSAVLGSDGKLTSTVRAAFGMPSTVTKMNIEFLDTNAKDIYTNTWIPRIRKTEGESDFELTYKKRYPIVNDNITAALTLANQEGFDSSDTNYDAQVEWGYMNKTLSISNKKTGKKSGYSGMDLPSASDSRKLLKDNVPGKMDKWLYNGWGTDMLNASRVYGPVLAKRSIGTWSGLETYIEVWPIKDAAGTGIENVVEISFKTNSSTTASTKHDQLITYLQSQGWFLAQDSLKTQLIMDRY
ncbi:hypothetical protein OB236_29505 [Paenibacillus sp. WQ 127069]|uniref:CYTH domain-containing protein n=1 Tax=Paenibacillus baimaensis TaxID=2982185 RepID=A0ABT2UNX2_9BACL|nr:hypothetical protein [Paenibacillus sp. WQ 127069]MCU6796267.1 hypothetical protein [Paenibacillus sp. WQ 127069]